MLTSLEFGIIEFLSLNPGRVFDTEKIYENTGGYDSDAELNVVWVYISYLRKKLNMLNAGVRLKVVRNAGYLLEVSHD